MNDSIPPSGGRADPFGRASIGAFVKLLAFCVTEICGADIANVELDEEELARAFRSVNIDLKHHNYQRRPTNGVSPGKLMGVVLYWMRQHRVVHYKVPPTSPSVMALQDVQNLAAINAVYLSLNIWVEHDWLLGKYPGKCVVSSQQRYLIDLKSELLYLIEANRINAESLGLWLDTLIVLDSALREWDAQTTSKSSIFGSP